MTAQLIGQQRSTIVYNRRSGRFRDSETGQFVPQSRVLLEIDRERVRTTTRLQGLARRLANQSITLGEWQQQSGQIIKDSHLRMAMMGAGGRSQMSSRHWGVLGRLLRDEYERLDRVAEQVKNGQFTQSQLLKRMEKYAGTTELSFHTADKLTKSRDGFEGMRSLDPASRHCPSCPAYSTNGEFVPAEEVVPIGTACECFYRCRCQIVWRQIGDGLSLLQAS